MTDRRFRSPWWLPGAHLQTIVPPFLPRPAVSYTRERWDTPDGDFIEVDRAGPHDPSRPTLVVFHGLEGDSRSPYAGALMREAATRGWNGLVPHYRGCSGPLNLGPRFYHSGDSAEADWVLQRVASAQSDGARVFVAGISIGGNILLKWLGEQGEGGKAIVARAAAVSAPMDLAAGGASLARGINRLYGCAFLRSLKPKCRAKLAQHPELFDRTKMESATDLREFDDAVTAPVHGFRGVGDYYARSSSKPLLAQIAVPTLVLNALNDPFLPAPALPAPRDVSPSVMLDFPETGGHVGFLDAGRDGRSWMPRRVARFLAE